MTNFVFYDFETTGTEPAFDQAIQFAAILTDESLKPIDEVNIRSRLAPHILPSPMALAVTKVAPSLLTDPDLPSPYEFTRQLSDLIDKWSPAIWTGYNSLKFDESFFRQMFYQYLEPRIYKTQLDGNRRLDILRAVYAAWALEPGALKIPQDDKGRLTSKLDLLAPANGFVDHDAHDALGDVRATIYVADLVRTRLPEIWNQLIRNTDKDAVRELCSSGAPLALVERFGAAPPRIYIGAYCGTSSKDQNQIGFFDLRNSDPAAIVDATDDALDRAVERSPKAIRSVRINSTPTFVELTEYSDEDVARAKVLLGADDLHARVGAALARRFEDREPSEFVEEQIYEGFISNADASLLVRFHAAPWKDRHEILTQVEDGRLRTLGERLLCLDTEYGAPTDLQQAFSNYVSEKWDAPADSKWTTFEKVDKELAEIQTTKKLEPAALAELVAFYDSKRPSK